MNIFRLIVIVLFVVTLLNFILFWIYVSSDSFNNKIDERIELIIDQELTELKLELLKNIPQPVEAVDGQDGSDGIDGISIKGDKGNDGESVTGPAGINGSNGREIEQGVLKDGTLLQRYVGDTKWNIVPTVEL